MITPEERKHLWDKADEWAKRLAEDLKVQFRGRLDNKEVDPNNPIPAGTITVSGSLSYDDVPTVSMTAQTQSYNFSLGETFSISEGYGRLIAKARKRLPYIVREAKHTVLPQ
jgi:hypothetical protein